MIPAWLEAVILGIVQGLTEFIPVSSSGHLVLVPYLMGWEKHSLAFDVMLHVGTLGATSAERGRKVRHHTCVPRPHRRRHRLSKGRRRPAAAVGGSACGWINA